MGKGKILIIFILGALIVLLWIGTISMMSEYREISAENKKLIANINELSKENAKYEEDIKYFQIPENLEKKLKEDFNYKRPGEKMIIIVPSQ